jgi:hypothetical protein
MKANYSSNKNFVDQGTPTARSNDLKSYSCPTSISYQKCIRLPGKQGLLLAALTPSTNLSANGLITICNRYSIFAQLILKIAGSYY